MKKLIAFLICLLVLMSAAEICSFGMSDEKLDGEVSRTTEIIREGVVCTHISLGDSSKYKRQEIWVVEFDPQDPVFDLQVTCGGKYTTKLVTVEETVKKFKDANVDKGLIPVVAINGDIWTTSYAHARILGSGTEYGGYSDPVVTHAMTLPRGLNIYNGEIVSSPHTAKETPYERQLHAFGITPDGRTVLGTPSLKMCLNDLSIEGFEQVNLSGLNRLPAKNSIMIYSDKVGEDTAALDDAYEIVIDCDYDYVIKHGATIKGKVTAICKEGDEDPKMQENRLIVTARGSKFIQKVKNIRVGDDVEVSFEISGAKNDGDIWSQVTNCVGGHTILVKKGKAVANTDSDVIPATAIGNTADGHVMFLVCDGRRKDYSVGLKISDMPGLCKALGYENCFLVDGGGSSTLLKESGGGNYEVVNIPCDKYEDGTYGKPRTVVNSIILSFIDESLVATSEPDQPSTEAPADPTAEIPTTDQYSGNTGCGSSVTALSALLTALASLFILRKQPELCKSKNRSGLFPGIRRGNRTRPDLDGGGGDSEMFDKGFVEHRVIPETAS